MIDGCNLYDSLADIEDRLRVELEHISRSNLSTQEVRFIHLVEKTLHHLRQIRLGHQGLEESLPMALGDSNSVAISLCLTDRAQSLGRLIAILHLLEGLTHGSTPEEK